MDSFKVAARFIAFTCSLNGETARSPEEAARYARENWKGFLPYVRKDLAIFLAAPPPSLTASPGTRRPEARKIIGRRITV